MTRTLAEVIPGQEVRIVRVAGSSAFQRRLADLGLVRRSLVRVQRLAPLGDPLEIRVKGTSLALRKSEARGIEVEDVE